tara:strand:+ start:1778 stop:2164 length:387 start_codon:yes stop_codon:yes gene_type:complete
MKKKPLPIKEAAKQTELNSNIKPICKPLKIESMLMVFIKRGSRGVNRIEAIYEYGDTALNSTVSNLVHRYGISFKRISEKRKNRVNEFNRFIRYSLLTCKDEEKAKSLVNSFRVRRGLTPIEWEVVTK